MNLREGLLIALTFLIGMMLTALPLPTWAVWIRPSWTLMILLFWLIMLPHRVGITVAFIVGLFLDLLTGTLFGQHALIFTIIAYVILRFQAQVRSLPLWQQTLLVLVTTIIYLAIQYWIMALGGISRDASRYWLPVITTTLLWPWVQLLLKDYQNRFKLG